MAISREEQLKILGLMQDSEIDYTDAPATNTEFWQDATLNIPPSKSSSLTKHQDSLLVNYKSLQLKVFLFLFLAKDTDQRGYFLRNNILLLE